MRSDVSPGRVVAGAGMIVSALLLAAAAPEPVREYDAPDAESARRSLQDEIALAKKHAYRHKPLPIVNATTTTTPEIEHVETGARCRFWYRSADIRFPWLDDRALECTTSYDWVSAAIQLYDLNGPLRPQPDHTPAILKVPKALPDLARALAQDHVKISSGGRVVLMSPVERLATPAGRRIDYVRFTIEGPGGGPKGTAQRHYQSYHAAKIDGWLVVAAAYGSKHYGKSLDDYSRSNFAKVIASMEERGRLPTFRKP